MYPFHSKQISQRAVPKLEWHVAARLSPFLDLITWRSRSDHVISFQFVFNGMIYIFYFITIFISLEQTLKDHWKYSFSCLPNRQTLWTWLVLIKRKVTNKTQSDRSVRRAIIDTPLTVATAKTMFRNIYSTYILYVAAEKCASFTKTGTWTDWNALLDTKTTFQQKLHFVQLVSCLSVPGSSWKTLRDVQSLPQKQLNFKVCVTTRIIWSGIRGSLGRKMAGIVGINNCSFWELIIITHIHNHDTDNMSAINAAPKTTKNSILFFSFWR